MFVPFTIRVLIVYTALLDLIWSQKRPKTTFSFLFSAGKIHFAVHIFNRNMVVQQFYSGSTLHSINDQQARV